MKINTNQYLFSPSLIFGIGRHRCKVILSGKVLGVAFVYVFVRVRVLISARQLVAGLPQ